MEEGVSPRYRKTTQERIILYSGDNPIYKNLRDQLPRAPIPALRIVATRASVATARKIYRISQTIAIYYCLLDEIEVA